MSEELYYLIALTRLPGIGPSKARLLLKACGSAEEIFKSKTRELLSIPEIGPATAKALRSIDRSKIEEIMQFLENKGVRTASFLSEHYPDRLKHCDDAPVLLYGIGNFHWHPPRAISIVGTRKATPYGKEFCQSLIQSLARYEPTIISGLAYGIDACAHQAALDAGLETIACVAHGPERIYPDTHRALAGKMLSQGGIVTEFAPYTPMAPEMFPMRNRLIAGMADCTVVIETDLKGGSMITAHIANSYGREVFAVPGRIHDRNSRGCNALIKRHIAGILTSPEDLIEYLNWDAPRDKSAEQLKLFTSLPPEQLQLVNIIQELQKAAFDELINRTGLPWGELNSLLTMLEFEGIIKSLPGKRFAISG
ncbi:MAG: DNA-processing protein DprA [Flavobacteriales bacterium]|jgi:DNA processing protein